MTKEHQDPLFEIVNIDESNKVFYAASGDRFNVGLNSMTIKSTKTI